MEWVDNPPVVAFGTSKRDTLQPYLTAMAENKGKWLLIHRAANSRTTAYYLRKRYLQLEVTYAKNPTEETDKWDIYARHREDA